MAAVAAAIRDGIGSAGQAVGMGRNQEASSAKMGDALPEGIHSLLDTDLYKLTMQCAILRFMSDIRTSSFLSVIAHTRDAFLCGDDES